MAPGHCGAIFSAVRRCRWLSSRLRCISRFSLARSSLLVSSLYCAVNSCNFPPSLPVRFQLVRFLFFLPFVFQVPIAAGYVSLFSHGRWRMVCILIICTTVFPIAAVSAPYYAALGFLTQVRVIGLC